MLLVENSNTVKHRECRVFTRFLRFRTIVPRYKPKEAHSNIIENLFRSEGSP